MMKNKVIVKAVFPSIDKTYDIKIPVNEVLWKINKLIVKAIYDMNGMNINLREDNFVIINKTNGKLYGNNEVIIDTDIRNGTELLFLKEK